MRKTTSDTNDYSKQSLFYVLKHIWEVQTELSDLWPLGVWNQNKAKEVLL